LIRLQAQLDNLQADIETTETAQATAERERDTARRERDRACRQRDTAQEQLNQLIRENQSLRQNNPQSKTFANTFPTHPQFSDNSNLSSPIIDDYDSDDSEPETVIYPSSFPSQKNKGKAKAQPTETEQSNSETETEIFYDAYNAEQEFAQENILLKNL